MRLTLVVFALSMLVVSCGGGDEYGDAPASTDLTTGGGSPSSTEPAANPSVPDKPKSPPLSDKAKALRDIEKAIRKIGDPPSKVKMALERADEFGSGVVPADAQYFLGLILVHGQDYDRASDCFVKFVDNCPLDINYKWGHFNAVKAMTKAGRSSDAVKHYRKFSDIASGEEDYVKAAAKWLGTGFLEEGNFADAVSPLKEASSLGDKYAGQTMIEALWAAGKTDEARAAAQGLAKEFAESTEGERYRVLADRAKKVGKPAPELTVFGWTKMEGQDEFDPASMKGQVYVICMWSLAHRGTSKKAHAQLAKWIDKYGSEGFNAVCISKPFKFDLVKDEKDPGMGPEGELTQLNNWVFTYKDSLKIDDVRLGHDPDESLHEAYGYWKPPTWAVVDRKGTLRFIRSGHAADTISVLEKVIEKLLDEK